MHLKNLKFPALLIAVDRQEVGIDGLNAIKEFTDKTPKSSGVSLGADKDGFFCYTHRAASKRHESPEKIPVKEINFIETTG